MNMEIKKSEEGVFIKLNQRANLKDVIEFIAKNDVENPDKSAIKKAINSVGKMIRIADYYGEIKRTCKYDISVSDDKMAVYFEIEYAKDREMPEYYEIEESIKKMGIEVDIDIENIKNMLEKRIFNKKILIAKGEIAKKGKDAIIIYKVRAGKNNGNQKPKVDFAGNIDYKNLNYVENVNKGDVLAEKLPAGEGENGYNVYGEVLKSEPGNDVLIKGGQNTALEKNNTVLVAIASGTPLFAGDKLEIRKMIVLDEVGIKTGNIYFSGSVIVKGDVQSEYEIKADEDIKIFGNIENSRIEAGNNLVIIGNCYGKNEDAKIKAKGDIQVNFAENFTIEAKKKLIVNEGLINCKICAYEGIKALVRNGKIIGGETRAEQTVEVLNLGSDAGVKTIVKITGKLEEIEVLEAQIKELEWELKIIEKNIDSLEFLKKNKQEMYTEEKEELFVKFIRDKMNILQDKKVLEVRYEMLKYGIADKDFPEIIIRNKCYYGTKIFMKNRYYEVKNTLENIKFVLKEDKIVYEKI